MLSAANQGALVAGGKPAPGAPARQAVRVLRAFVYGGRVAAVGEELDLDAGFAAMLVAAHKAQRIAPAAPPPPAAPAPAPNPTSARRAAAPKENPRAEQ